MSDFKKMIADANKAIALDPKDVKAYVNRGRAYVQLEQYDAAISDLSRAIKLDPKNADAYAMRGGAYSQLGQYDAAISDYSHAIKLAPKFYGVYFARGLIYYYQLNQYDAAISDFSKAIKLNPNDDDYYCLRARVYCDKNQFDSSLADFNKAIELNPNGNISYYEGRGWSHFRLGQYHEAISDFSRAISSGTENLDAYYFRGDSYRRTGQLNLAKKDLAYVLDRDKNHKEAKSSLKAVESFSNFLDFNDLIDQGMAFCKVRDYGPALEKFETALRLIPPGDKELREDVRKFINDVKLCAQDKAKSDYFGSQAQELRRKIRNCQPS